MKQSIYNFFVLFFANIGRKYYNLDNRYKRRNLYVQ